MKKLLLILGIGLLSLTSCNEEVICNHTVEGMELIVSDSSNQHYDEETGYFYYIEYYMCPNCGYTMEKIVYTEDWETRYNFMNPKTR